MLLADMLVNQDFNTRMQAVAAPFRKKPAFPSVFTMRELWYRT